MESCFFFSVTILLLLLQYCMCIFWIKHSLTLSLSLSLLTHTHTHTGLGGVPGRPKGRAAALTQRIICSLKIHYMVTKQPRLQWLLISTLKISNSNILWQRDRLVVVSYLKLEGAYCISFSWFLTCPVG